MCEQATAAFRNRVSMLEYPLRQSAAKSKAAGCDIPPSISGARGCVGAVGRPQQNGRVGDLGVSMAGRETAP